RQFNEMANNERGARVRLSSLNPINPHNTPDSWESDALRQFDLGIEEVTEVSNIQGNPYLRLIRPMLMTEQCIHCHSQQDYKQGDIAGGVSVSIPLTELNITADKRMRELGLGHAGLWLLGIIGISIGGRKLKHRINESNQAYHALSESEERIRSTLSTSLDAIITIDATDKITTWNQQAACIFGWSADEVLGKSLADHIIPVRHREMYHDGIRAYLKTGEGSFLNKRTELIVLNKDNLEFPIEITIAPITLDDKPAFSAFIRDISKSKKAEIQIRQDYHSQRVIASVLEISMLSIPFKEKLEKSLDQILSTPWLTVQSRGVIFITDNETKSMVMAAQCGLAEEIKERCSKLEFGECLCGRAAEKQEVIFSSHINEDHTITYEGIKDHGHYTIPIMLEDNLMGILNLYLDAGHAKNDKEIQFLNVIANTLGNMINRYQSDEKLHYYAFYDELTDLPNRTLLFDRMTQCVEHARRHSNYQYAILFMDLDRFKNINDSLGHTIGDQVLEHVAKILLGCVRSDTTVSRLGGDEFSILLDDIDDVTDAYRTAERIHHELLKPMALERHEVFTSASIGIAIGQANYNNPADILRDADTAMYRAKQKGNAHTEVFDEKMHANAVNLLNLETELRRAVKREEFCLYYQPIVSSATGSIVGLEALLRWNHPERGIVSPTEFITVAEETGLISEISYWVLREACRQNQVWNSYDLTPYPLYISVNLSAVQFRQEGLVKKIENELQSLSFDTKNLRLEITESALIDNPKWVNQMLHDLKDSGIHLYLDDFGTGYS
ncbi:MAG: diguanylate cyclase, partial [Gammaproteobacteria bacterium]|nr:diguanylate cyclase [Gammaproteobacteria bacterium]